MDGESPWIHRDPALAERPLHMGMGAYGPKTAMPRILNVLDRYDVKVCWVCWSTFGPREMGDKTKPELPPGAENDPVAMYVEPAPDAVPHISATSEINLLDAWNGVGAYANDHKKRQNYRVIAVVQQPNFLMVAANKKSGMTDLNQLKTRTQPTWIATSGGGGIDEILAYYGVSEESLKAKGGGMIRAQQRERRAEADLFIGGVVLAHTPEQRMWYEVSQLDDLQFFDLPEPLLAKLAQLPGYTRATAPIALLRGAERPIPTVMRSAHVIYVREEAPERFAYTVAKRWTNTRNCSGCTATVVRHQARREEHGHSAGVRR